MRLTDRFYTGWGDEEEDIEEIDVDSEVEHEYLSSKDPLSGFDRVWFVLLVMVIVSVAASIFLLLNAVVVPVPVAW